MYVVKNDVISEGAVELQKRYINTVVVQAKMLIKLLNVSDTYYLEYHSTTSLEDESLKEVTPLSIQELEENYEYTTFRHKGSIVVMELGVYTNKVVPTLPYVTGRDICLVEYTNLIPEYQSFYFCIRGTNIKIRLGDIGTLKDDDEAFQYLTYIGNTEEVKQLLSEYVNSLSKGKNILYRGYQDSREGFLNKEIFSVMEEDERIPAYYLLDLPRAEYFINTQGNVVIVQNALTSDGLELHRTQANVLEFV